MGTPTIVIHCEPIMMKSRSTFLCFILAVAGFLLFLGLVWNANWFNKKVVASPLKYFERMISTAVGGSNSSEDRFPSAAKQAIKPKEVNSEINYKNVFLHPKTYSDLWIIISSSFIVRRLAYLDKTDMNEVTFRLITMRDKRIPLPSVYIIAHYKDNAKPPSACIPTELVSASLDGLDNYDGFLGRTKSLIPRQYESVSHITITTDKDCKNESDIIFIQTHERREFRYNFGICLHKGIGPDFKPKVLLDWVRLNLAVGAEILTIYIQTGAEKVYDLLLPYINKGVVEVLDWKLEPAITNNGSYHYGQTGVILECLWRNIYRVKYLGMNDADEFFIPMKHDTISKMMADVERLHGYRRPIASFVFTNTLLKDNGKLLPVVDKALESKQCSELDRDSLPPYFKRLKSCLQRGKVLKKMIIKPDGVYIPWVHWLLACREKTYVREFSVPEDIGLSFHYRPHWNKYGECSTPEVETRVIEKFFSNITNCS